MGAIRHQIIKKHEFTAEHSDTDDTPFHLHAVRIPRSEVTEATDPGPAPSYITTRIKRESTVSARQPYEIRVRPVGRVSPAADEHVPEEAVQPTNEEIEALWVARLEQTREEAHAEGFAAGRAAAKSEFARDLDEATRRFGEDLAKMQEAWTTFMRDAEPQIVQLSFRIARTILDAPLPDDVRRICERALAEAVESMTDEVPIEILLHPVSYLRIQESGIEEHLSIIHSKLRWRSNPDLQQNEWVVQSARATTRRLEAELIDRLQRDLSMRDTQREEDGE